MKRAIQTILMTAVLAAPALTFAQSNNGPVTRAQVKAELVQIEKAGYQPAKNSLYYPADIQAAEARVHAQSQTNAAYGGTVSGTTAAGSSADAQSIPN